MRFLFILSFIIGFFSELSGQVVLNLQLPPAGVTMKSQLWNILLINAENIEKQIRIEIVCTEIGTNRRVFTAVSNTFSIGKGGKQLQAMDISPVVYTVNNAAYNIDTRQEGFLPVGTFDMCYNLLQLGKEGWEPAGSECESIVVEPISPPILVSPGDSDRLETSRPMFSWIPPAPQELFLNLSYDWLITEVRQSQNPDDAIQKNIPVLRQSFLQTTNMLYPPSVPALDTGKIYAWQVTALNGTSVVAKSEIWTFRIGDNQEIVGLAAGQQSYTRLKKLQDASYVLSKGKLNYEYLNELNDSIVNVEVIDLSSGKRNKVDIDTETVPLKYGQNFLTIDLDNNSAMIEKHIYLLELTNSRREKWYIKFEYRK